MKYYTYILTNYTKTVLYVGVTNDLYKRVREHKSKALPGFTAQYNVSLLIYYEEYDDISEAIAREKQLKGRSRIKKLQLIQKKNPSLDEMIV